MQTQKAIPFIYKHNNNYELTEQAENLLASIKTTFSVVTVAGLYRTGKSYLLNRVIINRSAAFNVGPTVNPCTKGLWIWAQPIKTSSGKTLLVVDTEGLGALDEQNNHDMKIFCMAVLLSSNFIYNSVGSIDEQALQTLSFVLNLVSNIDQSNSSNKPNFLWVVRDFALQLINDQGEQITSNQYLQFALNADIQKQANKKQLRKTILQAFEERKCFTLIKPLIDEQKLQNLDQVPPEQLRVQFISQSTYLRNYIMDSLKDFKMNNAALTGKQYVLMIKRYLSAINNNAVPDLLDTWGYIKQAKQYESSQRLKSNFIQRLNAKIYSKLPMKYVKLCQMLNSLKAQLIQEYLSQSYQQNISKEIQEYLHLHEQQLQRINKEHTLTFLDQLLKKQYEPFHKKLLSNYYMHPQDFQNDIKNVFKTNIDDNYSQKLDLPDNYILLYTQKRTSQCIRLFYKRSKEQFQQIKQVKSQIQSTCLNEIKNQNTAFNSQRIKLHQDIVILQKRLMMSQSQRDKLSLMLSERNEEKSAQMNQYQRKIEESQNQMFNMEQEMKRLQFNGSQAEKNVFALSKQLQKQKALFLQKIAHLQNQLQDSHRKQSTQQHQFNFFAQSWQQQKRKLLHQFQLKVQTLTRQKKQLMDHVNELNHHVQQQQFVNHNLKNELEMIKGKYCSQFEIMKQKLHNSSKKQKKQDNEDIIIQLNRAREKITKYQQEFTIIENKYKILNEQLKISKSHNDKQDAIHAQTIQFKEQQIKSLKQKYNQLKNAYQKKLSQPSSNAVEMELTFKKRFKELQMEHGKNIRDLQDGFESKQRNMKQEISRLMKQIQELEIKLSLERKCKESGDKQLRISYMNLQQQYDKLINKYNVSAQRHDEIQRQNSKIFNGRVKMLQDEIEMLKDKKSQEMAEHSRRSQSQISTIRQYMETERMKFEKKMQQLREKSNIKEKELCEEWKKKISQQREQFQQNIAEMQQKQQLMAKQYLQNYQTMKCDLQIKIQKMSNITLEEKIELNKKYALLQQEYQMNRQSLIAQIEEKNKLYHISLQTQKKDMLFEFEQQIQSARSAMQELQGRSDQLKKNMRKVQEANLLLKSQSDKQKALHRQKEGNYNRKMKELQQRYGNELRNHTRLVQELNSQHIQENKRMNGEIQRLLQQLSKLEEQKIRLQDQFSQQKTALMTKNQYTQAKYKRAKQEHEDLLKKFQTTVKSLANHKNQKDLQKQMEQSHKRMKEQYNKKIAQKQQSINQQKKQSQQKIKGLQTQNKSLRDKLLMYEMRQSSLNRYDHFDSNEKDMYEKVINELRQQLQKQKNQNRRLANEKSQDNSFVMQRSKFMDRGQPTQHLIRMERSRLEDKEERRQSFLNQDYNQKVLFENKSLLNRKPETSIKKVEKRISNVEDFGGIMRWKNQ